MGTTPKTETTQDRLVRALATLLIEEAAAAAREMRERDPDYLTDRDTLAEMARQMTGGLEGQVQEQVNALLMDTVPYLDVPPGALFELWDHPGEWLYKTARGWYVDANDRGVHGECDPDYLCRVVDGV